MSENHKVEIKIPEYKGCCTGIQIYIDRERINALGLYPLNGEGRRVENLVGADLEFDVLELEVRDIEDIAVLMNKETFDKFCELWRKYHNANKE